MMKSDPSIEKRHDLDNPVTQKVKFVSCENDVLTELDKYGLLDVTMFSGICDQYST
jgi:hypothetical protein